MPRDPVSHRRLDVWRKACDLAEAVYTLSRSFPREEQYGLTSQMRRAAVSVPANIAEGSGRWGVREFHRFVSIARGSLAELDALAELSRRFGYLTSEQITGLQAQMSEVARMLVGLSRGLDQAKDAGAG